MIHYEGISNRICKSKSILCWNRDKIFLDFATVVEKNILCDGCSTFLLEISGSLVWLIILHNKACRLKLCNNANPEVVKPFYKNTDLDLLG